jgi:hypothetical protein
MMAKALALIVSLLFSSLGSYALAEVNIPNLNIPQIEKLTGEKGQYDLNDKSFKILVPRNDLNIVMSGVPITPEMGLTSWVTFKKAGNLAYINGDLILLQDQINPIMSLALAAGLQVTGLNNPYLWDSPRVMFMHIKGEGDELQLAKTVGQLFNKMVVTNNGGGDFPLGYFDYLPTTLDPEKIETIVGEKGQLKDGAFRIELNPTATHSWAVFTGTDNEAIVSGSISLRSSDLQKALVRLRSAKIYILAIYQDTADNVGGYTSINFWGVGNTQNLAKSLKDVFVIARNSISTNIEEMTEGLTSTIASNSYHEDIGIPPMQVALLQNKSCGCGYAKAIEFYGPMREEQDARLAYQWEINNKVHNLLQIASDEVKILVSLLPVTTQKIRETLPSARVTLSKLSVARNPVAELLIIRDAQPRISVATRIGSDLLANKPYPSAVVLLSYLSVVQHNSPNYTYQVALPYQIVNFLGSYLSKWSQQVKATLPFLSLPMANYKVALQVNVNKTVSVATPSPHVEVVASGQTNLNLLQKSLNTELPLPRVPTVVIVDAKPVIQSLPVKSNLSPITNVKILEKPFLSELALPTVPIVQEFSMNTAADLMNAELLEKSLYNEWPVIPVPDVRGIVSADIKSSLLAMQPQAVTTIIGQTNQQLLARILDNHLSAPEAPDVRGVVSINIKSLSTIPAPVTITGQTNQQLLARVLDNHLSALGAPDVRGVVSANIKLLSTAPAPAVISGQTNQQLLAKMFSSGLTMPAAPDVKSVVTATFVPEKTSPSITGQTNLYLLGKSLASELPAPTLPQIKSVPTINIVQGRTNVQMIEKTLSTNILSPTLPDIHSIVTASISNIPTGHTNLKVLEKSIANELPHPQAQDVHNTVTARVAEDETNLQLLQKTLSNELPLPKVPDVHNEVTVDVSKIQSPVKAVTKIVTKTPMLSQHYAALPLPRNKVISDERKSIKSLPAVIPVQSVIHTKIQTARVSPPKKMEHIIQKSLHTAFHKPDYDSKPTIKSAKTEHRLPVAHYVYHEALIPVVEKPRHIETAKKQPLDQAVESGLHLSRNKHIISRPIEAPITPDDGPAVVGNYPYDEEPADGGFGG